MIYLDTSALVKLVVQESETAALVDWLRNRPAEPIVTSALGRVELMRTANKDGTTGMADRARDLLDSLDIIPVNDNVIATAESIGPPTLRSLDAIHLASAAQIGAELTALVAYDHRLLAGCRDLGYPTASPTGTNVEGT